MITSIELMSIVYKIVRNSQIKTVIDGEVFLSGNRPLNSSKNDVVIGTLSVPNSVLQPSTVLINIFVKDIFQNNNYLPNYTILRSATKMLLPLFDEIYLQTEKTFLDVEYQRDYKVEGTQEWVSVIRLTTRTLNN